METVIPWALGSSLDKCPQRESWVTEYSEIIRRRGREGRIRGFFYEFSSRGDSASIEMLVLAFFTESCNAILAL